MSNGGGEYEVYRNNYNRDGDMFNSYDFTGEVYVSFWSGDGKGNVEVIQNDDGYTLKLSGQRDHKHRFAITDETETEYQFRYYYDKELDTVILELDE